MPAGLYGFVASTGFCSICKRDVTYLIELGRSVQLLTYRKLISNVTEFTSGRGTMLSLIFPSAGHRSSAQGRWEVATSIRSGTETCTIGLASLHVGLEVTYLEYR